VARKSPGDDYIVEQPFGPSKAEQQQTMKMVMTVIGALIILGIGITLRFTVFADAFKPQPFTPPAAASPSPSPSAPAPSASPTP
jgi:hypothetical protein